jgi:hypothetical protein
VKKDLKLFNKGITYAEEMLQGREKPDIQKEVATVQLQESKKADIQKEVTTLLDIWLLSSLQHFFCICDALVE